MSEKSEKRPDKAVPLVIYKGGERIVIGSAYLKGDGEITGQISKDVRSELKDILFGDRVGDISINPTVPLSLKPNALSVLTEVKSKRITEVAVVPPLKIEET